MPNLIGNGADQISTNGMLGTLAFMDKESVVLRTDAKAYGVVGDGVTDDTAAVQSIVARLIASGRPWVLEFPEGEYLLSGEIDLSTATKSFSIIGAGKQRTIFRVSAFGADKKLFKGNAAGASFTYITMRDFSVRSVGDSRNKAHPTIFFFPNYSRLNFSFLEFTAIGNTPIIMGPAYNSDLNNIEIFSCGWQPLYKSTSGLTASTTSGSATLTASGAIFSAGDVGKTIYVRQHSNSSGNPSNSALIAVISGFTSSTVVTLDRTAFRTASGLLFSFDAPAGSVTSGSPTLTLDTACLDSSDVGRIITVMRGGTNFEPLTARIATVTSGTVAQLDVNASSTATAAVTFGSSIYIGAEVAADGGAAVNDITFSDIHIELNRGAGVIVDQGTNVHFSRFKCHGRQWSEYTDFAESRSAIIFNRTTRATVSQYQIEFGCNGLEDAPIFCGGGAVSSSFDHGVFGAVAHGGSLFEFASNSEQAALSIGSFIAPAVDWSRMAGLVVTSGDTAARKLFIGYAPSGMTFVTERSVRHPPAFAGQFRSATPTALADDAAINFTPFRDQGFVLLSTDSTTHNGMYWYRVDSTPNLQLVYAGSNLNNTTGVLAGTTGTDVKMTISAANDGKIYVENRSGASRTVCVTFLGG